MLCNMHTVGEESKLKWNLKKGRVCVQTVLPSGSTSRANFNASEVAKSELAGDTARMREFGFEMKDKIISCTWASMSSGWSPTGTCGNNNKESAEHRCCTPVDLWWLQICNVTLVYHDEVFAEFAHNKPNQHHCQVAAFTLVIPGKSTRVRLRTLGEKIFKYMGSGLIPCRMWKEERNSWTRCKMFNLRQHKILHQSFHLTLFSPEVRSVSVSISRRICWKSAKICQGEKGERTNQHHEYLRL